MFDAFEEAGGGKTGLERDADDLGAGGAGGFVVEKFVLIGSELAAFSDDFGCEAGDKIAGGWFVELGEVIDGGEIGENFGAFVSRIDERGERGGAGGVFGGAAGITAHTDDQNVTEATRMFEQAHMAGMEQIEGSGGANDALSVAFPLATLENQISLRNDCQFPLLRCDFRVPRKVNATQQQFIILSCEAEMHWRAA
jgi:hypothetical protein